MSSNREFLFGLTVVVALGASGLGVWQLSRLAARRAQNERAVVEAAAAIVDLSTSRFAGSVAYRRVKVGGQYDWGHEFVIRGRLLRGNPGIQIVTPLRLAGTDSAVLVNRGFVPTPDAGAIPNPTIYREPDSAAIEGIASDVPNEGDGGALETPQGVTWRRLDLAAMRARLPYPILPYYVIATADTNQTHEHTIKGRTLPIRIEPPPLDDGPHLSYAVQWFMIAGTVLGFGIVFVRRRLDGWMGGPTDGRGPDGLSPL